MAAIIKRATYRASQFFAALNPSITAEEAALVNDILGDNLAALSLFQRMKATDQKHAIAVLQTILHWQEDGSALLQAALLHDVGKAMGQSLIHRVLIVLLKAFWPALLRKLANAPLNSPAWRKPFVIHAQHPTIGAGWAREANCNSLAVTLIEIHQQQPPAQPANQLERLHQILFKADGMN